MTDINILIADLKADCEWLTQADLPDAAGYREDTADMLDATLTLQARIIESLQLPPDQYPERLLHDLRSPLNVIIGYAQMIAYDADLTETVRQTAERIYVDGDKLANTLTAVFGQVPTGSDVIY